MPGPWMMLGAVVAALFGFRGFVWWLRRRAQRLDDLPPMPSEPEPDSGPSLVLQMSGDGAMQIVSAGGNSITFNEPTPDPDPAPPSREVPDIVRRIIEELNDPYESTYVEAVCLAARSDLDFTPDSEVATLCRAADAGDEAGLVDAARSMGARGWPASEAFLVPFPLRAAELADELGVHVHGAVLDAIARLDPGRAEKLADQAEDHVGRLIMLSHMTIAATDEGETGALSTRWAELGKQLDGRDKEEWENEEVRRLVLVDLDAALVLHDALRLERGVPEPATRLLMKRLARADAERARSMMGEHQGEPYDWLPYVAGCAAGGLDMSEPFGQCVERLVPTAFPTAYRVASAFGMLLEAGFENDDTELVAAALEQAGAHAWQVTQLALGAMRELALRGSPALPDVLDLCMQIREPGAVAARDASTGLVAGNVMHRPAWLRFETIHPLELLVLQAELKESTPRWTAPMWRP